jgi:hypothetical protein
VISTKEQKKMGNRDDTAQTIEPQEYTSYLEEE